MRARRHVLATVALGLLVAACSEDDTAPTGLGQSSGIVAGTVESATPTDSTGYLSGVPVALVGTSLAAYTDSAGRFAIRDVPPGQYTMVVTALDQGRRLAIEVLAGDTTDVGIVTLATAGPTPRVVWTSPAQGQVGGVAAYPLRRGSGLLTGVDERNSPIDMGLQIRFSAPMEVASVRRALSLHRAGSTEQLGLTLRQQGGDLFALFPTEGFAIGEEYVLSVGAAAKDRDGRALTEPFTSTFLPEPAFAVEATSPTDEASGVAAYTSVALAFNAPLGASVFGAISIDPPADLNRHSPETNAVVLVPQRPLDLATAYTVTVSTTAADTAGNRLPEAYAFTFTTSDLPDWLDVTFTGASGQPYYSFLFPAPFLTEDSTVSVLGLAQSATWLDDRSLVEIYVNDEMVVTLPVRKNRFVGQVHLALGENDIRTVLVIDGRTQMEERLVLFRLDPDAETGVQVLLDWRGDFDLDLHLISPEGQDCFYGDSRPDWGRLGDPSDDPVLGADTAIDFMTGSNREAVFMADPGPGEYQVRVHYFDVLTDTVAALPTVTVRIDGEESRYDARALGVSLTRDEVWHAASFTIDEGNRLTRAEGGRAKPVRLNAISRAALPAK